MYPTSHSSGSRGPSFDQSPAGSRGPSLDATSSLYSDPFVDRALSNPSISSSSGGSRSSSRVRASTDQQPGRNPWSPLNSENGGSPPPDIPARPGLPSSGSDLSRQLSAALSEDLPPPNPETSDQMGVYGRKRSESGATLKAKSQAGVKPNSSSSFLQQFRASSGWFAPMVEPEQPLSREEYAAKEKERIEKLKNGSKSARRPGLMKRLSSGLELSGFGGGGSPTKR